MEAYRDLKKEKNDVDLMIVGDGPRRDELISLCQQEQIKDVHLLGFISNEQLPLYYSIADVFVFPSTRDIFGQVVLEAMACGLPVVISNKVNIWREVAEAGAGVITDCDPSQVAEAISKLVDDRKLCMKMGKNL